MFNWKEEEIPVCSYCKTELIDTLEHRLFHCGESRKFWSPIVQWLTDNLGLTFMFTVCEILLGIISTHYGILHMINYLIPMVVHETIRTHQNKAERPFPLLTQAAKLSETQVMH